MRSSQVSQVKLRRIVSAEIKRQQLQEGVWDDVKAGVVKLAAYVTKQFGAVATKWSSAIRDSLTKMGAMPEDVKAVFEAVKLGMQSTGESFQMSPGLKAAKELGQFNKTHVLSIVEQDFAGPVKEKLQTANEGFHVRSLYKVLAETDITARDNKRLDESLTVGTVLGVSLAIMGGLPMLFNGLHKLANVLHAEKSAELFEKAYHVVHHFEEKTIDVVIPDKLAYFVYSTLWKRGLKITKDHLDFMHFQLNKAALHKSQGLIYKAVLIYFAWNGLQGVLHAGASLLGFVEGTATTVKGIELARGATEIANIVRASSTVV